MNNKFENNDTSYSPDFGLPEGYFQKSAGAVLNKIGWLEEHKEFPVLLSLNHINSFNVPLEYFSKSEQSLELLDCPVLKGMAKQTGFIILESYFEDLKVLELSKVIGDSESVLEKIPEQNSFKIQADYFPNNAKLLEEKLLTKDGKIISLFRKAGLLAIAALLVVTLGFWLYSTYFITREIKDCGTIACIDRVELLKAKNLESFENDELYELVNTKLLEEKLEKNDTKINDNKKPDSFPEENDTLLLDEI